MGNKFAFFYCATWTQSLHWYFDIKLGCFYLLFVWYVNESWFTLSRKFSAATSTEENKPTLTNSGTRLKRDTVETTTEHSTEPSMYPGIQSPNYMTPLSISI